MRHQYPDVFVMTKLQRAARYLVRFSLQSNDQLRITSLFVHKSED